MAAAEVSSSLFVQTSTQGTCPTLCSEGAVLSVDALHPVRPPWDSLGGFCSARPQLFTVLVVLLVLETMVENTERGASAKKGVGSLPQPKINPESRPTAGGCLLILPTMRGAAASGARASRPLVESSCVSE